MSLTIDPVNNPSLSAIVLTSPASLDWSVAGGEKSVVFRGLFYDTTPAAAHTLREDLFTIVNDLQEVTIAYSGESGVDGTYFLVNASVTSRKIANGSYNYSIEAVLV